MYERSGAASMEICEVQFFRNSRRTRTMSMAKMDILMRANRVRKDVVISISSFIQTVEQFKFIASIVYQ